MFDPDRAQLNGVPPARVPTFTPSALGSLSMLCAGWRGGHLDREPRSVVYSELILWAKVLFFSGQREATGR